jgi:hypothetical protein
MSDYLCLGVAKDGKFVFFNKAMEQVSHKDFKVNPSDTELD